VFSAPVPQFSTCTELPITVELVEMNGDPAPGWIYLIGDTIGVNTYNGGYAGSYDIQWKLTGMMTATVLEPFRIKVKLNEDEPAN